MSTFRARLLATLIVTGLSAGLVGVVLAPAVPSPVVEEPVVLEPLPPPPPRFADIQHTIRRGETLGVILARYGVDDVGALLAAAKPFTDLTRIRAGGVMTFRFEQGVDHPLELRYPLDEDNTLVVDLVGDEPVASLESVEYEHLLGVKELTLNSSLWSAAIDAGLRPGDIVAIAKVFQWELDFNTELRPGARFTVVADQLLADGEYVKAGELYAVRLLNGDKTYTAVRFTDSDGRDGWYHPDGTASRRPFLRSPLEFSRVTSSFTKKRYHPVLKRNRAHLGTDFGAATGTPVRAVGDGVVDFAATNGGHGRHVRLDHEGPYTTSYSHLSVIKVKKGQRVRQGDVIGLVGSTGLSTGPHLHFEFKVSGKHVDPMKVALPQSEPLPHAEMAAFQRERDKWLAVLDGGPLPTPPAEPPVEDALVDGG